MFLRIYAPSIALYTKKIQRIFDSQVRNRLQKEKKRSLKLIQDYSLK